MSEEFDINEFMKPPVEPVAQVAEIDVQKAVVEELAAEKAELHEHISCIEGRNAELAENLEKVESAVKAKEGEIAAKVAEIAAKEGEIASLRDALVAKEGEIKAIAEKLAAAEAQIAALNQKLDEKLMKELDQQERNPNALALLDRETELPDRFPGETRDHVLEVVKEARDVAEKEGRIRRAQLLEGVLVANEPNGGLAKKRVALAKFFKDNGNIVTGVVIKELERCGIKYKDGEKYLLPKEIMLRTY